MPVGIQNLLSAGAQSRIPTPSTSVGPDCGGAPVMSRMCQVASMSPTVFTPSLWPCCASSSRTELSIWNVKERCEGPENWICHRAACNSVPHTRMHCLRARGKSQLILITHYFLLALVYTKKSNATRPSKTQKALPHWRTQAMRASGCWATRARLTAGSTLLIKDWRLRFAGMASQILDSGGPARIACQLCC